ncbi:hypothetical protein IAT40_002889 [Kwoniella sp. CBS 6097]
MSAKLLVAPSSTAPTNPTTNTDSNFATQEKHSQTDDFTWEVVFAELAKRRAELDDVKEDFEWSISPPSAPSSAGVTRSEESSYSTSVDDIASERTALRHLHEVEETYYTYSRKCGLNATQAIEFATTVGAYDAEEPYFRQTAFSGSLFVPVSVATKHFHEACDRTRKEAREAGSKIPTDLEIRRRLQYLDQADQENHKRIERYSAAFLTGSYNPSGYS